MHEHDQDLPPEHHGVARRLREERLEVSALELDETKQRVRARASRSNGAPTKLRAVTALLTLALLGSGGGAAVIAKKGGDNGGGGNGNGSDNSQYCPKSGEPKEKGKPGNKCGHDK